jgi:SAM-dependent methyltransferase
VSDIARAGYDAISERYLEWSLESDWPGRRIYLGYLLDELAPESAVLELGCGAGLPATRALVDAGHRVTAVDLSAAQLDLARRHVPGAHLIRAEMAELELPPAAFDAICAFHSLTHVPRELHAKLIAKIGRWLRPGGVLVASLGWSDNPDQTDEDWLGAPMFFSHFDAHANRELLRRARFELARDEVLSQVEFGQEVRFLWVLARRS